MPDTKLSALTAASTVGSGDYIYGATGIGGSPVSVAMTPLTLGASLVKLTETSIGSAASTLGCFFVIPSGFAELEFNIVDVVPSVDVPTLSIRLSNDGSTYDSGANYNQWRAFNYTAASPTNAGADAATSIAIDTPGNGATDVYCAKLRILNPISSKRKCGISHWSYYRTTSGPFVNVQGAFGWTDTGQVKGIQLAVSSGNLSSAKISVWAVR